jgi:hypothetical protein|tara:strand:+ start:184 stop:354 length:171 start_codon:yes stop_codon:yes gene_type:complete
MKYDSSVFKTNSNYKKEVGDRKLPRGGGGDYTLAEVKKGGNGNRYYKGTIYGNNKG